MVPMWLSDYGFDTNNCHEEEMGVGENSRKNTGKDSYLLLETIEKIFQETKK